MLEFARRSAAIIARFWSSFALQFKVLAAIAMPVSDIFKVAFAAVFVDEDERFRTAVGADRRIVNAIFKGPMARFL